MNLVLSIVNMGNTTRRDVGCSGCWTRANPMQDDSDAIIYMEVGRDILGGKYWCAVIVDGRVYVKGTSIRWSRVSALPHELGGKWEYSRDIE